MDVVLAGAAAVIGGSLTYALKTRWLAALLAGEASVRRFAGGLAVLTMGCACIVAALEGEALGASSVARLLLVFAGSLLVIDGVALAFARAEKAPARTRVPWWVLWLLILISLGIRTQLAPEGVPRPPWVSHLITAAVLVAAGLRFRAEAARKFVAEGRAGQDGPVEYAQQQ